MGITLANGRWYLPRQLAIELSRAGSEETEPLVFRSPTQIAGPMDHWVVALPAQAAFTLTIHSTDFTSTSTRPGGTRPDVLRVRLTGRPITSDLNPDMTGMQRLRLWTGQTDSNALRLSDCSP